MVPTGPAAARVLALAADQGGMTRGLRSWKRASYAGMLLAARAWRFRGAGSTLTRITGSRADIEPKTGARRSPGLSLMAAPAGAER